MMYTKNGEKMTKCDEYQQRSTPMTERKASTVVSKASKEFARFISNPKGFNYSSHWLYPCSYLHTGTKYLFGI